MTTQARTRADMCPGVWRPWPAEDGLLIRIRLPGGHICLDALHRLSEVSQRYGDGRVYLTRRANLQVRGLPGDGMVLSAPVVAALQSTGLVPTRTHELARNITASPQTGLAGGRADLRPVIGELDDTLCATAEFSRLPGRFLFTLDDGRGDLVGRLTGVGKRGTDLGCAALTDDEAQLRIGDHWGAVVPLGQAAERMVDLAAAFLDARGDGPDAAWHIRELADPLTAPVDPDPRLPASAPALSYGSVPGGTHVAADPLTPALVDSLRDHAGSPTHVVITPWRGVFVPEALEVSR